MIFSDFKRINCKVSHDYHILQEFSSEQSDLIADKLIYRLAMKPTIVLKLTLFTFTA